MPSLRKRLLVPVLLAALASCTEGTGPGSLGQLRLRPVFASGEEPATLGIAVSEIHVILRRAGGGIVADTSLPYVDGETTSWLIDLTESPESIEVNANIGQGAATMYSGSGPASISTGIGSSSTQHDLPVRYLGGGATFTIDVTPDSSVLVSIAETRQLTAVAHDTNNVALSGFTFTWSSSRPDVATVNASGLVTAIAPGRAEITASSGGVSGIAVVTVLVNGPGAASIVVTPDVATLISLGATQQFKATAIDANGIVLTGVVFQWASSNGAVASVNGTGLATALGAGATAISASANGVTGVAVLGVSLPPTLPQFIIVSPASALLTTIGATQQFNAVAFDAMGVIVPSASFTWSSSNPAVATVAANGVATAVSQGIVSIVATTAGRTGSASLTVAIPIVPASGDHPRPAGTRSRRRQQHAIHSRGVVTPTATSCLESR